MADPYGLELSGLTPELSAEAASLARRQKVAEAMGMQAMQPLQTNRMAGRTVVPISPFEGFAQLLRGYSSNKALEGIDTQRADIAKRGRDAVTAEIARIQGIGEGTPGSTATHVADDQLAYGGAPEDTTQTQVVTPGVKGDPRRMVTEAMLSPLPQVQKYGQVMAGQEQAKAQLQAQQEFARQQANENRQARLDQLTMQLASREMEGEQNRAARQQMQEQANQLRREMQEAQIAARRDMASLAGSLRQPQPLESVVGPDGKPMLVSRQDAVGKQPWQKTGGGMSPTAQKELIQTDEEIQGITQALGLIKQAKDINSKAMGGFGSGAIATAGSVLPKGMRPQVIDDTLALDNLVTNSALPQMKSIFGGNPTEGERKVLLDVAGSSSKPAEVRAEIFKRAEEAMNTRLKFNREKAKKLRSGTYFANDGGLDQGAAPPGAPPAAAPAATPQRRVVDW